MGLPSITEIEVLERVDEYSLYCFYLKQDPIIGAKFSSPLRPGDDDPSFGLYERLRVSKIYPTELMWKDLAKSSHNYGDIFDLVQYMYGLQTRTQGLWKICIDFKLTKYEGGLKSEALWVHKEAKYKEPIHIHISSTPFRDRDYAYWAQYGVDQEILEFYGVQKVAAYWISDKQQTPYFPTQCYAYDIFGKYQLYQPFETKYKFRNNWSDLCIPGMKQVTPGPLLIHTKAMKDIMCLRGLGFEATAPRGENMRPDPRFVKWANKNFNRVVTFFDNDGKTGAAAYPWESIEIPEGFPKDPSDYYKKYGSTKTLNLIKELLWPKK